METAAGALFQGSVTCHFCRAVESHVLHGDLTLASHEILTEQSIFIKDSEQFQSSSEITLSEAIYDRI